MKLIGDLLSRDLSREIEEIIKVYQTDEHSVYEELTEYVATDRIREQYRGLFGAIAEAPAEPTEGIGVWISGFFGSGKSSFAKNLGYVLANRTVLDERASELFKKQLNHKRIAEFIDLINAKIPIEVLMFDVSVDRAVRRATEKITEVMYTVLLRELDYAEDYDVAELEIELEEEGKLEALIARCAEKFGIDWRAVRKGAQKIARASALLHELDPSTYPAQDTWAQSLQGKRADITVGRFVERAFELIQRRRPGKALVFIVDEVGQYVSRSADKIEDLRAVVEQFGRVGKNLVNAGKTPAPAWVIVTSQEKLDEVVAAIDSKRVDIAKLQDRFKHRVDLAPADIREVATKRVLAKTDAGEEHLRKLYKREQGRLNIACRLERTARKSDVSEDQFVQFYPYLPYQIELSIDIVSGIRDQPGAPRHLGGSNRTIIKQAYEMLVSDRTAIAKQTIGKLVTLDKIYELVEGNLSTEKQKDISDVMERFKGDAEDHGMAARVAKTVALLEFVRDLPRTEANIAASLVDEVGQPSPLSEVQRAIKKLTEAQFIRNTDQGWKLQTAQEKNWDTERRGHLEPRPKARNEIIRGALSGIFSEAKLKTYRFRDLKSFRVGITINGMSVGDEGQLTLSIYTADDAKDFPAKAAEVRNESRQEPHKNDIYWVFALTPEIDDLIANVFASGQMVAKYEQMRALNQITNIELTCLSNEKNEQATFQNRLRDKLLAALATGWGLFRGVDHHGSDLGNEMSEILKKFFDAIVPDLYSKLEMGVRPLRGNEADEVLKSANLSALPQIFYGGEKGLDLVIKEGTKFVPNPSAEVATEILNFIKREHAYGNKVTGKDIDQHFGGVGYGWERDLLQTVLAVLLRAGAVEVTYQGRRFRNHLDPQCRVPFTNNIAFKSASFAPRESIDLKTLTVAVQHYEELTGEEVDVEESAIASALKKTAEAELTRLLPAIATAKANELSVAEALEAYRVTLEGITAAASDDCVRILAGEGKSLKEAADQARRIREALNDANLRLIKQARVTMTQIWPEFESRSGAAPLIEKADNLAALIGSNTFYEKLPAISDITNEIKAGYAALYSELHRKRGEAFDKAADEIKGLPEWPQIPKDLNQAILAPLASRACIEPDLSDDALVCRKCRATLSQMDSDLAALTGLKAQVLARVHELIDTEAKKAGTRIERIKVLDFFAEPLDSEEAVNEAIDRLRDHLQKLISEKVKIILE
jgi:hypothetical protein